MIRKKAVLIVAVLLLAGFACSVSAAEFTADMVISSAQGGGMPGKVFVKGQKMRQEIETSQGEQAMILDPAKNVIYVLMPGAPIYMEVENKEPSVVALDENQTLESRFEGEAEVTHEGVETIEGYTCDKYFVDFHDPEMGESTIWVAGKINFPIKIHSKNPKDTVTVVYSNIKEGPVEDSLFSVPPDYQKMEFGVSG
ncbi:MAG: DUF4412 domain-containing protein [Thermovirgaceae bacterium]